MSNTAKRTISGIGFIGIMLGGLLVNKYLYALLFVSIMVGMMTEFYRMTLGDSFKASRALSILAAVFFFMLVFHATTTGISYRIVAFALAPLLFVMGNSLYHNKVNDFGKFSHIYAGLVYIATPLTLSNLLVLDRSGDFNGNLMLAFFILIWSSDVGAFCFGLLLHNKFPRKLFEEISPKKTWIGFWGGAIVSVISGIIMCKVGLLPISMIHCIALCIVTHVAGVYGDLFESQWKRCFNLKDSSNLIPGHGGLLDRFDSAIFAIPAGILYMILFNLNAIIV